MKDKYNAVRVKNWRKENPEKEEANRIRIAFRLLMRKGVISGDRVVYDPTKI